jgi:MFS family permease
MSHSPEIELPWWKHLNRNHWFVFIVATLAWVFDCLDQQLFTIARTPAVKAMLGAGADSVEIKKWAGYSTSVFVLGWATGGLIFGMVGDRIGRARTLSLTVLIYSLCTGLSAFSQNMTQFMVFRFVTGLGVGGVFGLAVALVADTVPDKSRPRALGLLQSLSAVGNITAGLLAMLIGWLETHKLEPGSSWRYLFVIGALPAFLCFFIQFRLKEPERWIQAKAAGLTTGKKMGSYASLLGEKRWRRSALLGMLICIAAVVGLWGIGMFSPELAGDVIGKGLKADQVPVREQEGWKTYWIGVNMVMVQIGAFFGMMAFTRLTEKVGRRIAFAIGFVCACAMTIIFFRHFDQRSEIFWMSPLLGFFQFALFAGFALYLPELFPTRLRSTGTSFCYNIGRFIAASGPWTLANLQASLVPAGASSEAKLQAFRDAACWMAGIYLIGLIALPFLPETKGRPLPEDE